MGAFRNIIKSEDGSILGMVLIFFLVLTIIGTAFLSLAAQEGKLSIRSVQRTQAFASAESGINIGLWRLNHGPDSQGTFSNGSISVTYDSVAQILTSTGTSATVSKTVSVELWQDHPFNHILTFVESLDTSNFTLTSMQSHEIIQFDKLPTVDLAYYYSIADYVYSSDQNFSDTLNSGIHYVSGHVDAKEGTYLDGTLIATKGVKFTAHVTINAQMVPDTTIYYPALIVCDTTYSEYDEISGNPNLTINGAIYSTGFVCFKGKLLSGPIIAPYIELKSGVVIDDLDNPQYYNNPPGFEILEGDYNKYIKKGSWTSSN